jgi:NAD(P)-dependent dehydrogenase (short-subunit alcohol dehydrogenase family)
MKNTQMLKGKHALIFGAGGSFGSVVAREFAAEGADVFLSGRSRANVQEVAKQITADGGMAHAAIVDAEDPAAVDAYIDGIAEEAGSIDVVFNLVGPRLKEYGGGKPATQLTVDEFMAPLVRLVKSQFITSRAAARHMVEQRTGVILFVTGSPARPHTPGATAIGAAFGAIENLTRNLAQDVSPCGVRVVCVRTAATPETRTIQELQASMSAAMNIPDAQVFKSLAEMTLLKVSPTIADMARAAAFAASDNARMMTGTVLNSSAGSAID